MSDLFWLTDKWSIYGRSFPRATVNLAPMTDVC